MNVEKGMAFATSRVVVNFGDNIEMEGYHCSQLSSHIIDAHLLTEHSDILFTTAPSTM